MFLVLLQLFCNDACYVCCKFVWPGSAYTARAASPPARALHLQDSNMRYPSPQDVLPSHRARSIPSRSFGASRGNATQVLNIIRHSSRGKVTMGFALHTMSLSYLVVAREVEYSPWFCHLSVVICHTAPVCHKGVSTMMWTLLSLTQLLSSPGSWRRRMLQVLLQTTIMIPQGNTL